MAGTAVLGLAGLIILAVTARVLGAADYAVFGVFWSAVFFVVAVLFGAQQESTRSVAQHVPGPGRSSLLTFAAVVGLVAAVVVVISSPVWEPASLTWNVELVLAVAAGGVGYALTGVVAGAFAGAGQWRPYAAMLVSEGLSRLVLVLVVLLAIGGVTSLAWAVVAAYPVTLAVGIVMVRRHEVSLHVDDSMRRLAINTVKTMAAAASVAALVNGFPLLMSTFAHDTSEATVGALTLAVMLTRAPLLVPLMALQSLLIKRFSEPDQPLLAILTRLVLLGVLAAAVLAALAATVGPALFEVAFGPEFVLPGHVLGLLVLSSGLIGALSVTSPALVASGLHGANVVGWLTAVVGCVAVLAFVPADLETRVPLALLAGPLVGLVLHFVAVWRATSSART